MYATGADSTQLRTLLRLAALQQWDCLLHPFAGREVGFPFSSKGTRGDGDRQTSEDPGGSEAGTTWEHWLVTSAMHGLVTSPKDWSSFRD